MKKPGKRKQRQHKNDKTTEDEEKEEDKDESKGEEKHETHKEKEAKNTIKLIEQHYNKIKFFDNEEARKKKAKTTPK